MNQRKARLSSLPVKNQIMSNDENYNLPDALDELYVDFEPFDKEPDEAVKEDLQEFLDFMGFTPGSLQMCLYSFPWVFGNLEDPNWLGRTDVASHEFIIQTEPNEAFFYVDTVLLHAKYERRTKESWLYAIKALVRDKIVYFPLPIAEMTENTKYAFKEIFRLAQTEEA